MEAETVETKWSTCCVVVSLGGTAEHDRGMTRIRQAPKGCSVYTYRRSATLGGNNATVSQEKCYDL